MSAILQKIEHDMFPGGILGKIALSCLIFIIIILSFITLSIVSMFERTMESQTITYNVSGMNVEDEKTVLIVIENAFASWEDANPGITFERGTNGMSVIFTEFLPSHIAGMGICPWSWSSSEDGCYIFINSILINARHLLTNTAAHEMGHVLGVSHTTNEKHLMHGSVGFFEFDDTKYNIPNKLKNYDYIYGDYSFNPISMSCHPHTACDIMYNRNS